MEHSHPVDPSSRRDIVRAHAEHAVSQRPILGLSGSPHPPHPPHPVRGTEPHRIPCGERDPQVPARQRAPDLVPQRPAFSFACTCDSGSCGRSSAARCSSWPPGPETARGHRGSTASNRRRTLAKRPRAHLVRRSGAGARSRASRSRREARWGRERPGPPRRSDLAPGTVVRSTWAPAIARRRSSLQSAPRPGWAP
jgi:hypothetical protein